MLLLQPPLQPLRPLSTYSTTVSVPISSSSTTSTATDTPNSKEDVESSNTSKKFKTDYSFLNSYIHNNEINQNLSNAPSNDDAGNVSNNRFRQ
ncbi:10874_t:CDS:2 [Entrophospora sp. SA101]|nr:10874_t:CDS:2 [Entrophospora sp. SA101]